MATKIKGLQMWCRKMTDGYRDVDVTDFTTSWRNGMAFCALIHRFRPDLIDYDSLSKENVYDNNHLAFTVAEQELDIPAFLEAADMVALKTPDKLSVITYVSQYYNKLNSLPQLGGPGVQEKTAPAASAGLKRHQKSEPLSEPEPKKQPPARQIGGSSDNKAKGKSLGDKCAICKNKVYLLERHIEDGQLYHRSCYRHSDLSPTSKVYTRSPFLSPSLHGKEGESTPTSKSTSSIASLDKASDVRKTYVVEDKHGLKRPSEDSKNDTKSKKSDVQKFLFSDTNRAGGKPATDQNRSETKDSGFSKGDLGLKDRQRPSDLQIPTRPETFDAAQKDKKLSPTPKFDARTYEKHSRDFLSAEKGAKDVTSPKRQLPLVFQAAAESEGKTSIFSKNKEDGKSQPSSLSANKFESKSGIQLSGKKTENHPKSSALAGSKADSCATSTSESKVLEKITGPVAKPRHVAAGRKVFEDKMDTSESVQVRDKPAHVPTPAPRSSLFNMEGSQTSVPNKAKSPLALRKARDRPKSPGRNLSPEPSSPPPLPSSAPPPLPLSAPASRSRSPTPSPRQPPTSTAPSSRETAMQSKSREALLPKKSSEPSSKSPRQQVPGVPSVGDSAATSSTKSPRLQGASPAVSSVLSSSSSKGSSASSSGHRDKLTPPTRPPPPTSVSSSKLNSATSSISSPRPPPLVTITSASKSSSASTGGGSSVSSTFTSKSTVSFPANKHGGKEPMDVDTSVSKAKDQQEATALTGLLKSLAHVRDTSSSTASSATITSASPHTATSSKSADQTHSRFSIPSSDSKGASSSRFVTSKVNRLQSKDTDHKLATGSAAGTKSKNDIVSPRDVRISEMTGKSGLSSQKHGSADAPGSSSSSEGKSKISPRLHDTNANVKVPDKKLGETVTVTLNTGSKRHEEPSKAKTSVLSSLELHQNGRSTDHVPQWKKNLADSRITATNKSHGTPMDTTDEASKLSVDAAAKRDRSRSAADVFNVKNLSTSTPKASTPDTSQPPPFTQVKLRESNSVTVEKKERRKSAGNVLENNSGSKPDWQLEAERRMAALRDTGFVDPEKKKSSSSSETDDVLEQNDQKDPLAKNDRKDPLAKTNRKEKPEDVATFKVLAANLSPRKEEVSEAKLKEGAKKGGEEMAKAGKGSRLDVVTFASKQPAAGEGGKEKGRTERTKINLNLKGILKSEEMIRDPPPKPERHKLVDDDGKRDSEVRPPPRKTKTTPKDSPEQALPEEEEVSVTKKKITMGNDGEDGAISPPCTDRKKISVDVTFDFSASNSVEVTPKTTEPPATPKPTPPARPPPPKRTSMSPGRLSAIELQQQLLDIDGKLSELELRGRHLEDSIRSVAAEEEDDLMMEWFQLVTEKNELVRMETDLVYMSREQELEDEQSQLESQLHYLLSKDDNDKSFEERQEEEYLIQRKLDIVNQRNSIVDSMDEDRLRYEEEDRDIALMLQEKGFKKDGSSPAPKEKGQKQEKEKGKSPKEEKKRFGASMFYA